MTTQVPRLTAPPSRPRRARAAAWAVLVGLGACLLAAGCSSGGTSASGTTMGRAPAGNTGNVGEPAAAAPGPVRAAGSGAARRAGLTALPLPGGQAVIFTATLSLRAANVQAT